MSDAAAVAGPSAPAAARSHERYAALDVARGLAVIAMIYVHFVPTDGAVLPAGRLWTGLAEALDLYTPAAPFCVLMGMSWQIQTERAGGAPRFSRYVLRRVLALAAAGALLHAWAWPTEILLPLALLSALALLVRRTGAHSTATAAVLLVALAPAANAALGTLAQTDWLPDGTPLADSAPGWATVRYFLADGSYPVVPWLAFLLVGMLLLTGGLPSRERARRWCLGALGVMAATQAWVLWARSHEAALGGLVPFVTATWVPTSAPFALIAGGMAVALICGLIWLQAAHGLPRAATPLAQFGRASLTHYIAHICVVILPLRLVWPEEDWPVRVGALAFVAYVAVAVPLTVLWFRRRTHGPLEGAWALASGRAR